MEQMNILLHITTLNWENELLRTYYCEKMFTRMAKNNDSIVLALIV